MMGYPSESYSTSRSSSPSVTTMGAFAIALKYDSYDTRRERGGGGEGKGKESGPRGLVVDKPDHPLLQCHLSLPWGRGGGGGGQQGESEGER